MTEKKRLAGIELLRSVAMVMVITMHFVRESGTLPDSTMQSLTVVNLLAAVLESFCIVAVNAYVFISGYYGAARDFKISGLLQFLGRVWFYAMLIPVVMFCFGMPIMTDSMGIYGLLQYLLPISSEHYWFASTYFYLLLFMPILNYAVKSMDGKQLLKVITALLIVFCGIKSVVPVAFAFDRYGYDLIWFICVYLLAAWLRNYGGNAEAWLKKHRGILYVGSCLLIFALSVGLWKLTAFFDGLSYYSTVPFHYNFVLCLAGAIGLFYLFEGLKVSEGKLAEAIRKVGKYSFGVYLLHEHLDLRYVWYPALTEWMKPALSEGIAAFLGGLFVCIVLLFTVGVCIDWIRDKLFNGVCRVVKQTTIAKDGGE